ncbi:MAG: hypothetical protein EKK47_12560 [Burkholderiales bacterium]|nr:MAG: hypothetical protein EKK47_12560 [Burkholderiales bacterium]
MRHLLLSYRRAWWAVWVMTLGLLLAGAACAQAEAKTEADGIAFDCAPPSIPAIQVGMGRYLAELGIPPSLYVATRNPQTGVLNYALRTSADDHNTLDLFQRPGYEVGQDTVMLPRLHRPPEAVQTVSKKEIVLALMQHGRRTTFSGAACDVQALKDHVGLRQNIVAWTEHLHWVWPDGGSAQWHTRYWRKGTPTPGQPLHTALLDAFTHQDRYTIGCYTATKLVLLQGIIDFYRRVKEDPATWQLVTQRVQLDGDPLVHIEPGDMWQFEEDFDPSEQDRPGKLMRIQENVAPTNFVPGDWAYMVNTDPHTHHKTGYEGSNALYLGRNRFDDYFNDHDHAYSYEEKLGEVFQWRNGVFSRSRDADKIQPLNAQDIQKLGLKPVQGGLVKGYRVVPYLFAFEQLPAMANP